MFKQIVLRTLLVLIVFSALCWTSGVARATTCSTTGVDTAVEFIDLLDCLFALERDTSLAGLPADVQSRYSPYVSLLNSTRIQLNMKLKNDLLPNIPTQDLSDFENTIRTSGILNEIDAFISISNDPSTTPQALLDKSNAASNTNDTIKSLLDGLIESIPDWVPGSEAIKHLLHFLVDIVMEILQILGKK